MSRIYAIHQLKMQPDKNQAKMCLFLVASNPTLSVPALINYPNNVPGANIKTEHSQG